MTVSRLLLPAALAVVLTTTAAVSSAQTPQMPSDAPGRGPATNTRPFRGTFGGGLDNRAQTLTFTGSVGGGLDSQYLVAPADNPDAAGQGGGGMVVGSGTLTYALDKSRVNVSAEV